MNRIWVIALAFGIGAPALRAQTEWNRFVAYGGGGFTSPVSDVSQRLNTGWNVMAGGGLRLNRYFSLPIDFSYQGLDATVFNDSTRIGGNMRMWSFTLNPTFEYNTRSGFGGYATGGYGVYSRRLELTATDFDLAGYCDPWWGYCYPVVVDSNTVLRENTTYKGGFNVGGGLTFGPPKYRFFAEARYHYMFTRDIRTTTIPVAFGVRF